MANGPRSPHDRTLRRGLLMWALGSSVYLVAIFHRTSLGVASGLAGRRFRIGPAELSMFTVQQLVAAAALQLPAGVLVDRFGPRKTLTVALLVMAVGQAAFASTHSFPLGLAARTLLGLGDAATFVGVLRLTTSWCPERRIALLVQLTSVLGMAGNLISTVPLRMTLERLGWTPAFLGAALLTTAMAGVVVGVVRDRPHVAARTPNRPAPPSASRDRTEPPRDEPPASARRTPTWLREMRADISAVRRVRGTRLGFWMCFTGAFSFMAFSLLWGFPFLTRGQGLSAAAAGRLLMLLVVVNMTIGPVFGQIAATRPGSRVRVNVTTSAIVAALWACVLVWPGPAPLPLLILLVTALGMCGPSSMLGADVARTSNPGDRAATAAAMANTGGHAGTLAAVALVGAALNVAEALGFTDRTTYTVAFAVQWTLFPIGVRILLRHTGKLRTSDGQETQPTRA
ncbi:MFS transporter [Embleya hyalina]|uniref:Lysosomal dipeptide transporter MFSD1 n=1 Tax=Embleya hyalina TaxID=516124 RepID=A0A401YED3_9ACTN|nr:MFS transporter [Embleya hyalina]GCD92952.1 MFS transporter [Embleya hyalina]